MTKYFTMMSIRVVCFVLMVAVTPYGWYTWLFALGAIVLPYLAVVVANVAGGSARVAEAPAPSVRSLPASAPETATGVIRVHEAGRPAGTDLPGRRDAS